MRSWQQRFYTVSMKTCRQLNCTLQVFGGYVDSSLMTPGQAYSFETMGPVALLYLLFGTGLDPRQKHCYGPAYGIILVACSFGLVRSLAGQ